ncbi:hypothetical protein [Azospirillum largimobile]
MAVIRFDGYVTAPAPLLCVLAATFPKNSPHQRRRQGEGR